MAQVLTPKRIINIAIIAHVDHGKTTLVDNILKQTGTFRDNQEVIERVMDSNDQEKERGITIQSKCTTVSIYDQTICNIIDTPGHADFGGEVERVLSMADSVILLVDSAEGPMPQTKFVLGKALLKGLIPIVINNKIDRPDQRADEVVEETSELFMNLEANYQQLDFEVFYASGRQGWCVTNLKDPKKDLSPLFDHIANDIECPEYDLEAPFKMLATLLESDKFLGRILIGKVYQGTISANSQVHAIDINGNVVEQFRITKLLKFSGLKKVPTEWVQAGEIIAIAGMSKCSVSDTICDIRINEPIPSTPIDPPTMAVTISVNDSPLAGKEGSKLTSRVLRDRLMAEAETNVAIKIEESEKKDSFVVCGRGELQIGILIESMRREGFEFSVSRPRVLFKYDDNNKKMEPIEEVVIDVDDEFTGTVMNTLNARKGVMQDMITSSNGVTRIIYHIPSRALIGYHGSFLTQTRGTGIMNKVFLEYSEFRGEIEHKRNGALIATDGGSAVAYALYNLQDRGIIFIKPGDEVYQGMIVGEHSKNNDLEVNVLKGKQLTNMRASGSDEAIRLIPPKKLSLEEMISYIGDDELVEITPKSIRLRKTLLDPNSRKRASRKSS